MENEKVNSKNNESRDIETELVIAPPQERKLSKLEILKKVSSGTALREALNDIVLAGKGALILIENNNSGNVFQGGFRINSKFTSKRLAELAKMDGAIILSEDFKKIIYANTLLIPDTDLSTRETGTRHQAAERSAKQINGLVIAVSERRNTITLYSGDSRYVLKETEELLRRATETLQILEKQREVFDELIVNLNLLEINGLVSVGDVSRILERIEMIKKMANIINEHILELGRDGLIVRMRMREITKGIDKEYDSILKDYLSRPARVRQFFDTLSFEGLLDLENLAKFLFSKSLDEEIVPKGYRILNKTHLNKVEIETLIRNFKNLEEIFNADESSLKKILKNSFVNLQKEFNTLRENIMLGKKV